VGSLALFVATMGCTSPFRGAAIRSVAAQTGSDPHDIEVVGTLGAPDGPSRDGEKLRIRVGEEARDYDCAPRLHGSVHCYRRPGADGVPDELKTAASRAFDCLDPLTVARKATPRGAFLRWSVHSTLSTFGVAGCGMRSDFTCRLSTLAVGPYECAEHLAFTQWDDSVGAICDGSNPEACRSYCAGFFTRHDPQCASVAARLAAQGSQLLEQGKTEAALITDEDACSRGSLAACLASLRLLDGRLVSRTRGELVFVLHPLCASGDVNACGRLRALGE
jgi:hypothetical protein